MPEKLTLHAKKHYIEYAPGDVDRSMTIAAFYVAQGVPSEAYAPVMLPSVNPMRRDVVTFLASKSAVNHWLHTTNRLEKCPSDVKWLQLTNDGLSEIRESYSQSRNHATPERVRSWIESMTKGGGETEESKVFNGSLVMDSSFRGNQRTQTEAAAVMFDYFKQNKDRLPGAVTTKRDLIIERLMSGMEPEEAFKI